MGYCSARSLQLSRIRANIRRVGDFLKIIITKQNCKHNKKKIWVCDFVPTLRNKNVLNWMLSMSLLTKIIINRFHIEVIFFKVLEVLFQCICLQVLPCGNLRKDSVLNLHFSHLEFWTLLLSPSEYFTVSQTSSVWNLWYFTFGMWDSFC